MAQVFITCLSCANHFLLFIHKERTNMAALQGTQIQSKKVLFVAKILIKQPKSENGKIYFFSIFRSVFPSLFGVLFNSSKLSTD